MRQRGFTTIELMIVVTVMGMVLAASWPTFSSILRQHRLTSAATTVATHLRLARERAVAEGNDYVVTFRALQNDYQIWDDEGSDGIMGPTDTRTNFVMPSGTILQNPAFFGANRVVFRPDGTTNASGQLEVTNGETVREIRILAATGKISVNQP